VVEIEVAAIPTKGAQLAVSQVGVDRDGHGAPGRERHVGAHGELNEFGRKEKLLGLARAAVGPLDADRWIVVAHAQLVELRAGGVGGDLRGDHPDVAGTFPRHVLALHALVERAGKPTEIVACPHAHVRADDRSNMQLEDTPRLVCGRQPAAASVLGPRLQPARHVVGRRSGFALALCGDALRGARRKAKVLGAKALVARNP
jgi:hypothetical protein